ncbi:MAG: TIGR03960 family B12-binding radical SAM protein [Clostridia bacterium]|nr:TIGR03960 family B12-binding radical SAM protein [Clostridia bacterium]
MIPKKIAPYLSKVEKPARYIGGEVNEVKKDKEGKTRICFCFPDTYEIGMSNLGMRILYGVLNEEKDVYCERCFAPWPDMADVMRRENVPLWALESGDALSEFDMVAFTLQYELCYTNVLYMLDLAKIARFAADRGEDDPILLGGGPCAYNPEPMADFFDIFSIGEGEEALPELARLYTECKKAGLSKRDFLRRAAKLEGFYVPSLYEVTYKEDGTIASFEPKEEGVPKKIQKRIVRDFEHSYYPREQVLPFTDAVQDRVTLEVFRGCPGGCRFCQAGFANRPIRHRSAEALTKMARETVDATGYDEISLCALSISDYPHMKELCDSLLDFTKPEGISLSLPSMRLDSFSQELIDKTAGRRRASLTFAPEAGTQRMRDIINKGISEEDLERSLSFAFGSGYIAAKLYFMLGLPFEEDEDLLGISALAQKAVDLYYHNPNHVKGKSVSVSLSVACFIPKPMTPFQWVGQNEPDELLRKQKFLKSSITNRKVHYSYHGAASSRIEALLARGDRRLSRVISSVVDAGEAFSSWDDYFSYERWESAAQDAGLDISFYACRTIPTDEILPWDFLTAGVQRAYLESEYKKASAASPTAPCTKECHNCGVISSFGSPCKVKG